MATDAKRCLRMPEFSAGSARPFLSHLTASPQDRRKALGVVFVLSVLFATTAPYAKVPLTPAWAFIPVYQSALVVIELVTAVMLFGQFRYLGAPSLLALGSAYLFSAGMAILHALSFPGLFAADGLLGGGTQTTAWLYFAWHAGFPLGLIAYSRLTRFDDRPLQDHRGRRRVLVATCLAVCASIALLGWLATVHADVLPIIMHGNTDGPAKVVVATATWLLSLIALFVLWLQKRHAVLDIWCMVVALVWIFDVALAAVLNGARFDLGFYAGRIYGLLAGSFVLCVLLLEHSRLFAQLIQANHRERSERTAAESRSHELSVLNRELDSFTYSVSHDLRAPLRAIHGYSTIIDADFGTRLDADGKRMLHAIRRSATRMEQMIDGLLRLARLGRTPLQMRATNLDALVRERVEEICPAASRRSVEISVGRLGFVQADEPLLRHVIDNLIGNAIKYTREKPTPKIEIGRIDSTSKPEWPTFFVRDNGAGFDMEYAERLFGVFQRLHSDDRFEGHGIGLAIVKRIVERHGGRIWAEGRVDEGATFFLTLQSDEKALDGTTFDESTTAHAALPVEH